MAKKTDRAGKKHPSLSDVQGEVEQYVIENLQKKPGYKLLAGGEKVPIGNAHWDHWVMRWKKPSKKFSGGGEIEF